MPDTMGPARAHVILNAGSGGGCPPERPQELRALFAAQGVAAEVRLAHGGDDIVAFVKQALADAVPLVVAGGGDGTVSAVAAQLCGTQALLGVLPLGTLNHFARDLGIPLALDAAVEVAARGATKSIDAAEVNGRVFVNNASIGLYPRIVAQREEQRERLGRGKWLALALAALRTLRRYPVFTVELVVDGQPLLRETAFVFIGNNRYTVEGFDIGAREAVDRGEIALYTTQRTGRFGLVRLALRALLHQLAQAEDFDMRSAREVKVCTPRPRLRVATDGELQWMDTPLVFRSRPGALRVRVPPR